MSITKATATPTAAVNSVKIDSPRVAAAKAQYYAAKVKALEAIEYAQANPVKATGIVATISLAAYGGYRAVSDLIG